jgi:hypothetical protein
MSVADAGELSGLSANPSQDRYARRSVEKPDRAIRWHKGGLD